MRFVRRDPSAEPEVLQSEAAREYRRRVEAYLLSENREHRPPELPDHIFLHPQLHEALYRTFEARCAFCEIQYAGKDLRPEHFRPWAGADRGDGRIDYRHYCWLALDWSNLYMACAACARSKRNFFPVRYKAVDYERQVDRSLSNEISLLIDPCAAAPADHLMLEPDGSLIGTDDVGATTIKILNLNRPILKEQRADELRRFGLSQSGPLNVSQFPSFAFEARQGFAYPGTMLIRLIQDLPTGHRFRQWGREELTFERAMRLAEEGAAHGSRTMAARGDAVELQSIERRYIRRIIVNNFRGIESADIEFPPSANGEGKAAGSLALLGANAAGKTSLLQAAAIGSMGPAGAMAAGVKGSWCLRDGAFNGSVRIQFWDTDAENLVSFERGGEELSGAREVAVTVLGYGAYRLPARGLLGEARRRNDYRIHTLIEERARVNGPFGLERHLAEQGAGESSDDAARTLNALLAGAALAKVGVTGRIEIEENGRPRRLTELSSGYKSVLSIATDMMDVMYQTWGGISSGQALVLIDEIDVHLHPEWRLRIVEDLRKAFPLTQFLFTTHDPLVLRGLAPEEIRLVARSDAGGMKISRPALPSLKALDVDQLLTSDLFGLDTTLSVDVDRDLRSYYEGLANAGTSPTPELDALRERLSFSIPLGKSRRERLLYEVIDRYLAKSDRAEHVDAWDEGAVEQLLGEFDSLMADGLGDDPQA